MVPVIVSSNNPVIQNEVIVYNITLWYCHLGRNCNNYTFYNALYSVPVRVSISHHVLHIYVAVQGVRYSMQRSRFMLVLLQ